MALKNIQLAQISPSNRAEGKFTVTVYTDDGQAHATFDCSSEQDAIKLRTALRENADRLKNVFDGNR